MPGLFTLFTLSPEGSREGSPALLLPLLPPHHQRPNLPPNRPHRRTLLYPPRAPNSLSSYWLGGIHPDRRSPPCPGPVASTALRTLPLLPPLPLPLPPTLSRPARPRHNLHLHRPPHRPLLTTRNLRPLRPPPSPPHHSNPSQLRTRSTTRYLHKRRAFPHLCHPASVPPPTGTS